MVVLVGFIDVSAALRCRTELASMSQMAGWGLAMLKRGVFAATAVAILALAPEMASAQCVGSRFNVVEQQRLRVERRVTPGSSCTHYFDRRDLGTGAITVIKRPSQGRIEPASTGRGSYIYRSNAGASGGDSYVIRADFDVINTRSGVASGKTWTEVEFVITFTR
jgi:hypothetical protein